MDKGATPQSPFHGSGSVGAFANEVGFGLAWGKGPGHLNQIAFGNIVNKFSILRLIFVKVYPLFLKRLQCCFAIASGKTI